MVWIYLFLLSMLAMILNISIVGHSGWAPLQEFVIHTDLREGFSSKLKHQKVGITFRWSAFSGTTQLSATFYLKLLQS